MEYLRKVDFDAFDRERFSYQVLAETENCVIVIVRQPANGQAHGPQQHYHTGDQVYYVLEGALRIEIDGVKHTAEADSAVFIPAGASHSHTPLTDEIHIDIIAPTPIRGRPLGYLADEVLSVEPHITASYNAENALDRSNPRSSGWSRAAKDTPFRDTPVPGFRSQPLAWSQTGSNNIFVGIVDLAPGPGPSWHIHEFDQFYYVLEGQLTVDIANKHYEVAPHQLVVVPAGVPHRNWNRGGTHERHIAIMYPDPFKESPVDIDVNFSLVDSGVAAAS